MSADQRFTLAAEQLGYSFDGEIKIGGNYVPLLRHDDEVYISGQIPRVGDTVVVTGRVGDTVDLAQAQLAAKIGAMRALALLQRSLGSLDKVRRILRISVFVQCSAEFTQHSEVADGASDLLYQVLGEVGAHTRTSVGAYQLPKNASVELDLVAAVYPEA
ncbi:RidA family protein [Pseudomonas fontis]|uniref:RidA family protein n=1 Tax=Pseudomonas fontis TaxID=2942633 RepID=A0ABT5NYT6_9PSED|nr:RidA family protein [Pseudomonas fontis]MDD0973994.1 RidA family protein [Pseudomonas fontis]MDD0993360.1 RidA family protein [Pseudomonas fontis]